MEDEMGDEMGKEIVNCPTRRFFIHIWISQPRDQRKKYSDVLAMRWRRRLKVTWRRLRATCSHLLACCCRAMFSFTFKQIPFYSSLSRQRTWALTRIVSRIPYLTISSSSGPRSPLIFQVSHRAPSRSRSLRPPVHFVLPQ